MENLVGQVFGALCWSDRGHIKCVQGKRHPEKLFQPHVQMLQTGGLASVAPSCLRLTLFDLFLS